VAPYLAINYAASVAETRAWVEPVLSIPLPDPDADARQASVAERTLKRTEIITAERAAGLDVTQERVDQISAQLGLESVALAGLEQAAAPVEPEAPVLTAEEPLDPDDGGGEVEPEDAEAEGMDG
jgi:hypothetical protein